MNETDKERSYNNRVTQIENASFTPLVFRYSRGIAPKCRSFLLTSSIIYLS